VLELLRSDGRLTATPEEHDERDKRRGDDHAEADELALWRARPLLSPCRERTSEGQSCRSLAPLTALVRREKGPSAMSGTAGRSSLEDDSDDAEVRRPDLSSAQRRHHRCGTAPGSNRTSLTTTHSEESSGPLVIDLESLPAKRRSKRKRDRLKPLPSKDLRCTDSPTLPLRPRLRIGQRVAAGDRCRRLTVPQIAS
jgi:hypothetical protein